jgi:hypothetical protein
MNLNFQNILKIQCLQNYYSNKMGISMTLQPNCIIEELFLLYN